MLLRNTTASILLLATALGSAHAADGERAASSALQQALVTRGDHRIADIARVLLGGLAGPLVEVGDLHAEIRDTRLGTLDGVMVKLRFSSLYRYRHATTQTTPLQLSLHGSGRTLATLDGIRWDGECFHNSTFGAQIFVPDVRADAVESVAVAPLEATVRTCNSDSKRR